MINNDSIHTVDNSTFSNSFIKPLYESYCFSNIPGTISSLLTKPHANSLPDSVLRGIAQNYDHVILFLLDGFGWEIFNAAKERISFLQNWTTNGVVSKLTSQFPSTTAAQLTTLHTGLPVNQTGIYEWFYYEPHVDRLIAPLLYSYAGDTERETLSADHINPQDILPTNTLYKQLGEKNVQSFVFQNQAYAYSPYSKTLFNGAQIMPYKTVSEGLTSLSTHLQKPMQEKSYNYFYYGQIDTNAHAFGPYSEECKNEVDSFFSLFENILYNTVHGKIKNTLFIVTADHGHTEIDLTKTQYINKDHPGFSRYIKKNKKGNLIVPAGSFRDMFLHIEEQYLTEAKQYLQNNLSDVEVYTTEELINQNIFGNTKASDEFLKRVGNLVVLPTKNNGVWWYEKGVYEVLFKGHHGGLSRPEMEIPFLLLPM